MFTFELGRKHSIHDAFQHKLGEQIRKYKSNPNQTRSPDVCQPPFYIHNLDIPIGENVSF